MSLSLLSEIWEMCIDMLTLFTELMVDLIFPSESGVWSTSGAVRVKHQRCCHVWNTSGVVTVKPRGLRATSKSGVWSTSGAVTCEAPAVPSLLYTLDSSWVASFVRCYTLLIHLRGCFDMSWPSFTLAVEDCYVSSPYRVPWLLWYALSLSRVWLECEVLNPLLQLIAWLEKC